MSISDSVVCCLPTWKSDTNSSLSWGLRLASTKFNKLLVVKVFDEGNTLVSLFDSATFPDEAGKNSTVGTDSAVNSHGRSLCAASMVTNLILDWIPLGLFLDPGEWSPDPPPPVTIRITEWKAAAAELAAVQNAQDLVWYNKTTLSSLSITVSRKFWPFISSMWLMLSK